MGRVQDAMRRAAGHEAGDRNQDTAAETAALVEAPHEEAAATAELPFDADAMRVDETPKNGHKPVLRGGIAAKLAAKIVIDETMLASSREQYRRLAAVLHHGHEGSGMRVVMIASAVAGEGKSLTAANLALTFSESYQRTVLLIDGDLRRPDLHKMFGVDAPSGLSEALLSIDEAELSPVQVSERLTILPGGRPNSDPMAGLISPRMRRLIAEARELFDWVFIDTPPVGLLSDANLLAAMVDAAVLVIRADRTPYPLVRRAIDAIGRERIIGSVLNQSTAQARGTYYEYYHYYQMSRGKVTRGA